MKLRIAFILLIFVSIVVTSCKTSFRVQRYRFLLSVGDSYDTDTIWEKMLTNEIKGINLKNDSILVYWERYGGLVFQRTIRYTLTENDLFIDSMDVYKQGHIPEEISSTHFAYSKDSLINKKTNEIYFNQKYVQQGSKR